MGKFTPNAARALDYNHVYKHPPNIPDSVVPAGSDEASRRRPGARSSAPLTSQDRDDEAGYRPNCGYFAASPDDLASVRFVDNAACAIGRAAGRRQQPHGVSISKIFQMARAHPSASSVFPQPLTLQSINLHFKLFVCGPPRVTIIKAQQHSTL